MEKKGDVKGGQEKADYIIKGSATLQFNEYVKTTFPEINEEDRESILMQASQLMFQDLQEKTKDVFDSVGIWLTIADQVYENSIALSVMEGIQQYGEKGIVPIYELIKMTIPNE